METLLGQLKSKNILYAEDEESILNHTAEMLEFFFNNVICAKNGEEALKTYFENQDSLDIILLDLKMPYLNGLEVTKEIRKIDQNIPIIFISAYSDKDFLLEAIKFKLEDYILKPFALNKFLEVIDRVSKNCWRQESIVYIFSNAVQYIFSNRILIKDSRELPLGKKEEQLLRLLLQNPGEATTKEKIDEEIYEFEMTENKYRSLVKNLRNKIGYQSIETISGIGLKIRYKDVYYR